jgi:hypothetical protein
MNSQIRTMALSVLNRKPITDIFARENYKECIVDYLINLSTLEQLYVEISDIAYSQKQYLIKLLTLVDRYTKLGDSFLSDDKVEVFLLTLQNNCRDYLNNNLEKHFYNLRKQHHTKLAFSQKNELEEYQPSSRLADLKELAYSNMKRVNYSDVG